MSAALEKCVQKESNFFKMGGEGRIKIYFISLKSLSKWRIFKNWQLRFLVWIVSLVEWLKSDLLLKI